MIRYGISLLALTLLIRIPGVEREKMTVCGVKCILNLGEEFLSRCVINRTVAVMDKNVIFKDARVEVNRITRTGSVMLLSLLVG